MKIRTRKSIVQGLFLTLVFILGLSSISWGAEFWLRAETLTKTMPDTTVITMWGFASCTDGTYANCTAATSPGPRLTVPAGDTVLTINLRNNLTGLFVEPVSLVIPGLAPATAMTPDYFADSESRQRVRSFAPTTPADNSTTVTYSWTAKPGTYLYESGYHPAVQVQMGLYGAVTSDAAAGQAYGPSTAYSADAVLLFSEIDPVIHGHVTAGTYGTPPPTGITSTVDYEPRYFLINGEAFSAAAPIQLTGPISGQNLLLRFLSAGLKHRVPTIYGMNLSHVAEDGNLYPFPKNQYSLLLSPGKTIDALAPMVTGGDYAIFDRRLGLTNNTTTSGGMMAYLSVTPDLTPPTGSVVINGDAATTNSRSVVLTLNAVDPANNVSEMNFSWDNVTWLGWIPYATTANATIPIGPNGTKTIYVQFRDTEGNVSAGPISDSIDFIDNTPPTGSVLINGGAASTSNLAVTLTLSATDLDNAVTLMNFSWDNSTWLGWEAYGTTRNISIPAGPNGTKTIYVQFQDAVGNVSITYQDSIDFFADITPPTGSVLINGGAASTSNLAVTLTLSATDLDNAVTLMNFSWDNSTWLGWEAYGTTRNISIPAGPNGTKTIYVQFQDAVGNVSTSYQDSINYSVAPPLTAPTNLTAGIYAGPLRITLRWTDASNNETSFAVWRSDNGGAFTQIGTVLRTITNTTATGGTVVYTNNNVAPATLVIGHMYSYYVTAVNATNTSAPSNTVAVNYSIPAAPTLLSGSSVIISSTTDRVTLNWTDNSNNESNFQIQRATNATFTSSVNTYSVGTNVTTLIQNVARSLPTLYYRVRATNGIGASGWSNAVTVTTP